MSIKGVDINELSFCPRNCLRTLETPTLSDPNIFRQQLKNFSRLNTLCTPLVWMRIASVATKYTKSGYVIKCTSGIYCLIQNFAHCTSGIYCLVQNFVHCSRYRKCKILSAEYKMTILHYNST